MVDRAQFTERVITETIRPGGNTTTLVRDLFAGRSGVDIPPSAANPPTPLPEGFQQSQVARVNSEVSIPSFSLQTYTPGSDLAAGLQKNQVIYGRDGNDTLLGFDPFDNNPGNLQIDLFIGDIPILQPPNPRDWRDTFVLGDSKQPYYTDGGFNDFGIILDFNSSQDIIQLSGTRLDYRLAQSSLGTEIYYLPGRGESEFIGFLPFVYDLRLTGNYFQFEGLGSAPPSTAVIREAEQLGSPRFDITVGSATDPSGNVYTAGGTSASLGGSNAGATDGLLVKYDSDGNQKWIRQLGSSVADTAYAVTTDNAGNVFLTGVTAGNLAGTRQSSSTDAWIAKYDTNGNQQWVRQFGTDIINQAFDIETDDTGNVYVTGLTVKGEGGSGIPATDDYWVTKYDTNGNRIFFREFGSTVNPNGFNFDEAYGLAVNGDGSSYVSGWTLGNLGGTNAGLYDAFVAKQDTNGNQVWVRQFGTPTYEFSWDADSDTQGNVYATGWTLGNLGGTNAGQYDAWLVKYDTNGNQQWIRQFGGSGDDEAFGVQTGLDGSVYVTGYTDGSLEGSNAGSFDAWVAKYDSSGNRSWIQQFGTRDSDLGLGITIDDVSGSLYVTGTTESSLGAANAGTIDSWVAKLNAATGAIQNFAGTATGVPAGGTITGTSGNDRLVSSQGRDIITGAGGNDIFVYQSYTAGGDTITDFSRGDLIDVSGIFASPNYSSTTPFTEYIRVVPLGSSTAVQINPVGDSRDIFRTLVTLENFTASLTASDFVV